VPRKPKLPKPLPTPEAAIANLRHGITSRTLAIPGLEDHGEWVRYRDKVVESLHPEGEFEIELANSIAEYTWRRRRVARHEHHVVCVERERDILRAGWSEFKRRRDENRRSAQPDATAPAADAEPAVNPAIPVAAAAMSDPAFYEDWLMSMRIDNSVKPERMLPAGKELERIIRYETHLMRQALHALHELQALQARRKGEPAPLARLSVLGFSGD
jgi:hypothetical protein